MGILHPKTLLILALVGLLSLPLNYASHVDNKTLFEEMAPILQLGSLSIIGGDGFDQGVYDWINLKEFKKVKPSSFRFDHVVLVVVEFGAIHRSTWIQIKEKFGEYAARTITVAIVKGDSSYADIYTYDRVDEIPETDTSEHASKIVYMLKSMYPQLPILQIAVIGNFYITETGEKRTVMEKALNHTIKGYIYWKRPSGSKKDTIKEKIFVFSFSIDIGFTPRDKHHINRLDNILALLYGEGARFFAAAGNTNSPIDGKFDKNQSYYSWIENSKYMYLVGAIYDFEVESGYQSGQKTSFSNYDGQGEYSNKIRFSMPGYMIETYNGFHYVKVSGTSYAAPLATLSYTIALQTAVFLFLEVKERNPISDYEDRNQVAEIAYKAVIRGSENHRGDRVPRPRIDYLTDRVIWDKYNGYGCIDVHDSAIQAGAISLLDLPKQSESTKGDLVTINLQAKLLVSSIRDVWDSLVSKLGSILSVRYYVYRVFEDNHLGLISSGKLSLYSKDSRLGIIKYRGSVTIERISSNTAEIYVVVIRVVTIADSGAYLVFEESDIVYEVVFEGDYTVPPLLPY